MDNIKIYFSDDTEFSEMEAIECKGYRSDILIKIGDNFYQTEFITPMRVISEVNCLTNDYKGYMQKFSVVIVKQVDKQTIINTILELSKTSYFSYFTPYDKKMLKARGFEDWKNFVQVYPK